MSTNNIFIFKNVNSTKVGSGIIYWGILALVTVISFGTFRPSFIYILISATLVIIVGNIIFKALFRKPTLTIILNNENIEMIINHKTSQIQLTDFISIRTLDPNNQKNASLQFEVLSRNKKIGFFRMIAKEEQKIMSFLCKALVDQYNFKVKDVPFSIWTHNFSKVKYIEYKNPAFDGKVQ